jgi:hypothetical protein
MILRILSRTGTLDKLKGRVVTSEHGRYFLWGSKKSPCSIHLDANKPASEKPIPGGIQLDIAHIRTENRKHVYAEAHDTTSPENDLFLAVNLYLPADFSGERPIEVVQLNDGSMLRNRFFCDSADLIKLGLNRTPTLSIHAFVLIRKGEVARLLHRAKSNGKIGCWYVSYNSETPKIIYHKDYSAPPPCLA